MEESEQSEESDLRRRVRGGGSGDDATTRRQNRDAGGWRGRGLGHLQKGLPRGTWELRRAAKDVEAKDYLILITLIILISV